MKIIELIKKYKTIVKFIISGGTAAMVDLVFLYIFHDLFNLGLVVSVSAAYLVAFVVSFSLQKFWTFEDREKEKMHRQASGFFAVSTINFFLNTFLVKLLVDYDDIMLNSYLEYWLIEKYNIWYLFAQAFVSGLIGVESFLVYRYIIFRRTLNKFLKEGLRGNIK